MTASADPMADTPLDVTVVICTRNRARQLDAVLTSATRMHVPPGLRWEFLLIDNGSTDGTADVARGYAGRLPMRVVTEPVPGLSNARNRAVREARGRYMCWTDDDVRIGTGWLAAYVDAFARHPEAAVFGGRVVPVLEGGEAPDWFEQGKYEPPISSLLAYRDFGPAEFAFDFDRGQKPFGANYALRTAEQRAALYDPELGVSPLHKRLGEETDVIHRIAEAGGTGWWVPGSSVEHLIPPARQTSSYLFEYYFLAGATYAHLRQARGSRHYLVSQADARMGGLRFKLRCARGAARALRHYLRARHAMPHAGWVRAVADLGYQVGALSYGTRLASPLLGLRSRF